MRHFFNLLLLLALLPATPSAAQIAEWQGIVSTDWFNQINWSPEAVPAAGTNVIINTLTPHTTTLAGTATPDLGAIQVGETGDGQLLVDLGGKLFNNSIGMLATEPGSSGITMVRGAGSEWRIDHNLVVGQRGDALLTIADGGYVLNNSGRIGNESTGAGQVLVRTGSNWINLINLFVGHSGLGALEIRDSGSAVYNQAQAFVGYAADSEGSVLVRDSGLWAPYDAVFIGREGHGKLDIESGGAVALPNDNIGYVGVMSGGQGEVTVTGTNSQLVSEGGLIIGVRGNGQLVISNGAGVASTFVSIGDLAGGTGHVTVGENSLLFTAGGVIQVGREGTGSLKIAGGEVNSGEGVIGNNSGGHGVVALGGGARWNNGGLIVGNAGSAVLTIGPDAEVISSGGVLASGGSLLSSRIDLLGALTVNDAFGGAVITNSATLRGTGVVNGRLVVGNGGIVAPGLDPGEIGELRVSSLILGPEGVLNADLGPPPTSDRIVVSGDLQLGGLLQVNDVGGFAPGVYTLITYTGALIDNGLGIDSLPPLPAGYGAWIDTSTQPGEVRLVIAQSSDQIFADRFAN